MFVGSDLNFASSTTGKNVPLPVDAGDIASKAYVDAKAQGLVPKTACAAATTPAGGNITLATAPASIDAVTLAQDDRVLVKNQTDPIENGIYIFNGAGNAMTRATDMAAASHAQGVYVYINAGTVNIGTSWVCTTETPDDVVGTDELTFALFSVVTPYTFRDGLKRTGNYVDVDPGLGLSIAGGSGTSGKLDIHLDTVINSGNGGGLQIDAGSPGDGLSVKVDGTTVQLNASGQLTAPGAGTVLKYATDVGDGVNKDITVTHALNTTDVVVEVRAAAAPKTVVLVDWKVTGVNAIELNFKAKPASAEYRCVVMG
jgi:hypothetical protein